MFSWTFNAWTREATFSFANYPEYKWLKWGSLVSKCRLTSYSYNYYTISLSIAFVSTSNLHFSVLFLPATNFIRSERVHIKHTASIITETAQHFSELQAFSLYFFNNKSHNTHKPYSPDYRETDTTHWDATTEV